MPYCLCAWRTNNFFSAVVVGMSYCLCAWHTNNFFSAVVVGMSYCLCAWHTNNFFIYNFVGESNTNKSEKAKKFNLPILNKSRSIIHKAALSFHFQIHYPFFCSALYFFSAAWAFSKSNTTPLIQYLKPVGGGPSSKTCPKWALQRPHCVSVRTIPWLLSGV